MAIPCENHYKNIPVCLGGGLNMSEIFRIQYSENIYPIQWSPNSSVQWLPMHKLQDMLGQVSVAVTVLCLYFRFELSQWNLHSAICSHQGWFWLWMGLRLHTFDTLKENMLKALASVPLHTIRRWEQRMYWWMEAYRLGLGPNYAQLQVQQFSSTKYKSHRSIPDTVASAFDWGTSACVAVCQIGFAQISFLTQFLHKKKTLLGIDS